ncbi:MAG TPA: GTP cyclohydrolase I FolE [Myxococcota bacterium]
MNRNRKGRLAAVPRESNDLAIGQHVEAILSAIGEHPAREGLAKTPVRVARALRYLTKGYLEDPREVLRSALFNEDYDYQEMILCRDIDFFSLCEHHLLPFFGKAQVAYIPKRHIVGISKIARLVEVFSRRLQVQERMTTQIATMMMEALDPLGVGVVLKAEHLCMRMRGVEKQNSVVVTSAMLGTFRTHQATRQEFMTLIAP